MKNPTTTDSTDYAALHARLEPFRAALLDAIHDQLKRDSIVAPVLIESRIKSEESARAKLLRGIGGVTALGDLQDLLGIRIVVAFSRDVDALVAVVKRVSVVVREYDKQSQLGDERFGYSSRHLVVSARRRRKDSPAFSGLQAEVQVRTLAQHVWAVASHKLQYKTDESAPPSLSRDVNRVAALLETVDHEFERVLQQRDIHRRGVQLSNSSTPLDVDVLAVLLPQLWSTSYAPSPEVYDMLLGSLRKRGYATVGDLKRLVLSQQANVLAESRISADELVRLVDNGTKNGSSYTLKEGNSSRTMMAVTDEMIARAREGIFYTLSGLTFTALQFASGERTPPERLPGSRANHAS